MNLTIEGPDGAKTWSSELGTETAIVGRDSQCEIVITGSNVSRRHLRLRVDGEQVHFEDLGSSTGVFLIEADGVERRVADGVLGLDQRLRVGQWQIRHGGPSVPPRRTPSAPRLALEVTHPARPKQRFEFLTRKGLALEKNGQVTTNGHFGRGGNPELLFVQW